MGVKKVSYHLHVFLREGCGVICVLFTFFLWKPKKKQELKRGYWLEVLMYQMLTRLSFKKILMPCWIAWSWNVQHDQFHGGLFVIPWYPYLKAVEPFVFLFQGQWLTNQKRFWFQSPFLLSYYCTVWLPAVIDEMVIDALVKPRVFYLICLLDIYVWEYPGTVYR